MPWVIGVDKPVDDVEMMPVRLFDAIGGGAETLPDIGEQRVLAQEFRALRRPDPAGEANVFRRLQKRRALADGFFGVEADGAVQIGLQQRTQIVQAREREHMGDAAGDRWRKRRRLRHHAGDEMPAGRVADQADRAFDDLGRRLDRRGDLPGDGADTCLGAERIGRHRDRVAMADRPGGQMRPEGFVEADPEAAMHVDDEAFRRFVGQEEVEPVARALPVADVERRPAGDNAALAEARRGFDPKRRPALAAWNVRAVRIGVGPVLDAMQHARLPEIAPPQS